MSICQRFLLHPLFWILLLLLAGTGSPVAASGITAAPTGVEARQGAMEVDFSPLVTMARVAGCFSIGVALIWSTGLVVSARLHSGRRKAPTCGDQ